MADIPIRYEKNPDLGDSPVLAALRDYWDGKRNGRAMPSRGDIDPVEMKPFLGNLFIVEALPSLTDFRYRLIGSNLVPLHGRDVTGSTVTEVFAHRGPEAIEFVKAGYRSVLREEVLVRSRGSLIWGSKDFIRFDALHLPLLNAAGVPGLILGLMLAERLDALAAKGLPR